MAAASASSASLHLCNNSRFSPSCSKSFKPQYVFLKPISNRPFSLSLSNSLNPMINKSRSRCRCLRASFSGSQVWFSFLLSIYAICGFHLGKFGLNGCICFRGFVSLDWSNFCFNSKTEIDTKPELPKSVKAKSVEKVWKCVYLEKLGKILKFENQNSGFPSHLDIF